MDFNGYLLENYIQTYCHYRSLSTRMGLYRTAYILHFEPNIHLGHWQYRFAPAIDLMPYTFGLPARAELAATWGRWLQKYIPIRCERMRVGCPAA